MKKIFIIDRYFDAQFFPDKDIPGKLGIIDHSKDGFIRLPHLFKKRTKIEQKIILYHLYFMFLNNDRSVINGDTCMFEQIMGEGYSYELFLRSFIKLMKEIGPSLSELTIKRTENIIKY